MKAWISALGILRAIGPVRKSLRLPRNHSVAAAAASGVETVSRVERETYSREFPKILDSALERFYFGREHCEIGESNAYRMRSARVWGYYGGCVIDAEGRVVEEFSKDPWSVKYHRAYRQASLPKITKLAGKTLSLGTAEVDSNYWHWLIDLLPKIWLIEKGGLRLSDFDHVLINWKRHPYQTQTLAILGLEESKVIEMNESLHVECEDLVVAHLKTHIHEIRLETTQWLRSTFSKQGEAPAGISKRIYVSRSNCGIRRVENEEALLPLLESFGFQKILADEYGFLQQVGIFAQAEVVVAPHGAALANMLFCKAGTQLIEVFPPEYVDLGYWAIMHGMGIEHTVLFGEDRVVEEADYSHDRKTHLLIDERKLETLLKTLS